MKKVSIILFLFIAMVLTGCGSKPQDLDCSITQKQEGFEAKLNMISSFQNNEVKNINMNIDFVINDEYLKLATIETYRDAMKKEYEQFEKEGITVAVSNNQNTVNIKMNLEFDKISQADKEALNITDVHGTVSATRDELIKQGYTCK